MTKIDTYKHLDADSKLTVELNMDELAKRVCAMNYGVHRLLSAMVHEMRRRHQQFEKEYAERYPDWSGTDEGSPLADGIEALLNQGYTD